MVHASMVVDNLSGWLEQSNGVGYEKNQQPSRVDRLFAEISEFDEGKVLSTVDLGDGISQVRRFDKRLYAGWDLFVGLKFVIVIKTGAGWSETSLLYYPSAENAVIQCS